MSYIDTEDEVCYDSSGVEGCGALNDNPGLLQAFAEDGEIINDQLLRQADSSASQLSAEAGPAVVNGAGGGVFVADSSEWAFRTCGSILFPFSGEI